MDTTVPKLLDGSPPSSSKVMDVVRKFSNMSSSISTSSSSLPKPSLRPPGSGHPKDKIEDQKQTVKEDDRHDVNNKRGDIAKYDDIDPIEANKILSDHIEVLQHDCDVMSDILERVDHRLSAIERNSQALLDIVSIKNGNKTWSGNHRAATTTNALLCRLEAVDAYISSLQDIIDTQHAELQKLKGERNLDRDASVELGGNSETQKATTAESLDSSLSFQQLQRQYIRKIDLIAKLQDDNEIKDAQIEELQNQLEELQLERSAGMQKNSSTMSKRRIFRL